MMFTAPADLITIIETARNNFLIADWRHEYKGAADNVYCEGDVEGCLYCDAVAKAAEDADHQASLAINAISSGEIEAAIELLDAAMRIELEYGDAPAYGPALRALNSVAV